MTAPSNEHAALRELVADLATRAIEECGTLQSLWHQVRELGLDSIGVAEEWGGSGGSITDLAVTVGALGESALSVPVIEVATARWVLAETGTDADVAKLPIVVLTDQASAVVPDVSAGRSADLLIMYPPSGAPRAYDLSDRAVTIDPGANLAGEPRDTIDLGNAVGRELAGAPSAESVRSRLALLWAAALTGAIRGAYYATRAHVRTREQFGAPLIKIPAVASSLANFRMLVLLAEAALARALDSCDGLAGSADCPDGAAAAAARIIAASNATEAARIAHQLHGAMGVTQEGGLYRTTTRLWAWQDAETSERSWSVHLGDKAIDGGEDSVWSDLTAAF